MKTIKNSLKFIFGCCAVGLLVYATAFAGAEVGTVTYVEGRVDLQRQGTSMAVPLREGELIFLNDAVRTKSNSKAEITFKDKSILRLAQNSRIDITDYRLDEKGNRKTATVNLERGKARTIIAKMREPADFNILTPNTQGKIKGSDIYTFFQGGVSGMLVSSGTLSVVNTAFPANPVVIKPGNSVMVPKTELPRGPRQYLEIEKKLHEQDTNPPADFLRKKDLSLIRGVVTNVSGTVKLTSKAARAQRDARINELVGEGDSIETGSDGRIEIKFDNGNSINIKPGSRFLVVKLTADPKTGQYDNYFELSNGKIKAVIEKLPQDSSFRVKTPTAISGVRGTIIYVDAMPDTTKVTIEGGVGYITSLSSGKTQEVASGQTSATDASGDVTVPVTISTDERTQTTEGWEAGSAVEGYSKPEGQGGLALYEPVTDPQAISDSGGDTQDAGQGAGEEIVTESIVNEPQITETLPEIISPPEIIPPPPQEAGALGDLTGDFGYYDVEGGYSDIGSLAGKFEAAGVPWAQAVDFSISGTYELPEASARLWETGFFPITGSDGSVIMSVLGGTKLGDELDALLYGIYIHGNIAGYIKSTDISGSFSPDTGTFLASGFLGTNGYEGNTAISSGNLASAVEYNGISPFVIRGDIFGSGAGEAMELKEQNLSIGLLNAGGTYEGTPTDSSQAALRSTDSINDFWMGKFTGFSWSNNKLSATFSGKSMNTNSDTMGIITGDLIGTYDEGNNTWQAVMLGVNKELPLQFKGELAFSFGEGTNISGLLGGTESLWGSAPKELTMIGDFSDPGNYDFWTYFDDGVSGTTSDGGAFLGVFAGSKIFNNSKGLLYAFYVKPNGATNELGFIKSTDIAGDIYPEINMFEQSGQITAHSMSNVPAEDFSINDLSAESAEMRWDDPDTGLISGDNLSGNLSLSSAHIRGQHWGLWWMLSDGAYQNGGPGPGWSGVIGGHSRNPQTELIDSYWLGNMSTGDWQENELRASITGRHISYDASLIPFRDNTMGTFQGDMIGIYEDAPNWHAVGAGTWDEVPLQLGGILDGYFGYFDAGFGDVLGSGRLSAVAGSTVSLGVNPAPLTIIGEYTNLAGYSQWYDLNFLEGRTSDGGKFIARLGGIKVNDSLKGILYGIYIAPVGSGQYQSGYIKSTDIEGEFYPGIGMFEADGNIEAFPGALTGYSPDDLYEGSPALTTNRKSLGVISSDNITGTLATSSTTIGASEGYPATGRWLWWMAGGGSYEAVPSTDWNAHVSSRITSSESDALIGYYAGTVSGRPWSEAGEIFSEISGCWITNGEYGSFSGEGIGTYTDGEWQLIGIGESNNSTAGLVSHLLSGTDDNGGFGSGPEDAGGGEIHLSSFSGQMVNIDQQNRGVWNFSTNGTYENPVSVIGEVWDVYDLTGTTSSDNANYAGGSWLGGIGSLTEAGGSWINGKIEGTLEAIWLALRRDGTLSGRTVNGDLEGNYTPNYIDEVVERGTWNASSAGEWVEVIPVLDNQDLTADIIALGTASLPITEAYPNIIMTGAAGPITLLSMDTHLYCIPDLADGIWAAIINGSYATPPADIWSVTVQNGNDNATLTGPAWSNNQWVATNVIGTVSGNPITGTAAGTYGDNAFSGTGTGTWERGQ